jgi:hypothetical protein
MDRQSRAGLTAAERQFDTDVSIERAELRFDPLHPEFASKYGAK